MDVRNVILTKCAGCNVSRSPSGTHRAFVTKGPKHRTQEGDEGKRGVKGKVTTSPFHEDRL
jgi:hypothetical protein